MHYLAVSAIYLNEAPFLEEWIEFHRLVGVEKFFLYNHLSTDNHRAVLAPYVEEGIVEVTDWPHEPGQASAYQDCLDRHRRDARWIAFIDLDEFLFSPTYAPLPQVLKAYEPWPGVHVNWAVFGPSGHETRPQGLVIESYTSRAVDNHPWNRMCKCVVDPCRAIRIAAGVSAHAFDYTEGYGVDENFNLLDKRPRGQTKRSSWKRLRVNHYWIKSKEQWLEKLQVIRPDTGKTRHYDPDRYDEHAESYSRVRDEAILHYLPALKAALAERVNAASAS